MEILINRVCVASDFSTASELAIHYGAAFARKHNAELHLLHVVQDISEAVKHPDFTASGEETREYFSKLREESLTPEDEPQSEGLKTKAYLATLESAANDEFDKVKTPHWWEEITIVRALRFGSPVEEICRYAKRKQIDLLIVGTQGKTGMRHLLMGSVAEQVVRLSPCPVLAVRNNERHFIS